MLGNFVAIFSLSYQLLVQTRYPPPPKMVLLRNLIKRAKWIYAKNISTSLPPTILHVHDIGDTNERFGFFPPLRSIIFTISFVLIVSNFHHFWKRTLSNINVIMTFPYRPVSFVPPLSIALGVVYASVISEILAHNNNVRLDSWTCWRRLNSCA